MSTPSIIPTPSPHFAATRWTMILAAARGSSDPAARTALEELARIYWYPLYAYVRRQGHSAEQAEDLTQEFFATLLQRNSLRTVDRDKGKFRSFLLASLKHFLLNEWDKQRTLKRGGQQKILPWDSLNAEARYAIEPADSMTPDRLFEQRWAWALLDQVLLRLRDQYAAADQEPLFDALKTSLMGLPDIRTYAAIAKQLDMTENALTVAAHRLRKRYRALLREEIAQTVPDPALVDEEINYLLGCL